MLQQDLCSQQDQNHTAGNLSLLFKPAAKDIADLYAQRRQGEGDRTDEQDRRDDIHISAKYRNIIRETIIKVDFANNFVVLRTYAGMAQAAAAAIDGMGWSELVGSIAGDDTIFVMMRDNTGAIEFSEKLKQITRGN